MGGAPLCGGGSAVITAGLHPPKAASQSPLTPFPSPSQAPYPSFWPAARTHSLRCSGSPHRAGRGGDPYAKTAPAPFAPPFPTRPAPLGSRGDPVCSCRKENGPRPVQKKRTLRRVGLRKRIPPAAGGGWLALPRGSRHETRCSWGILAPGEGPDTGFSLFRWRYPGGCWGAVSPEK